MVCMTSGSVALTLYGRLPYHPCLLADICTSIGTTLLGFSVSQHSNLPSFNFNLNFILFSFNTIILRIGRLSTDPEICGNCYNATSLLTKQKGRGRPFSYQITTIPTVLDRSTWCFWCKPRYYTVRYGKSQPSDLALRWLRWRIGW